MPKLHKVSPLEHHLGFWLRFVSNEVSGRFEAGLAKHNVTPAEWVTLRSLYDREHTNHADLIQTLGMSKGAISKIVSKLEAKGLTARKSLEDKPRGQILCLTELGYALVPKLAAIADENDAYFFEHLTIENRQLTLKLMKELVIHHRLKQTPTK